MIRLVDEDVSRRTIAVSIKASKLTAKGLAYVLGTIARKIAKHHRAKQTPHGRQTVGQLMGQGASANSIEVEAPALFDRVARKYGIDYSLKKVEQEGKTEYLVFFKAKDVYVLTAAFKEYTNETLKKQKRESVRQKLEKVKEELSNHRQLKKEKKREQEPTR